MISLFWLFIISITGLGVCGGEKEKTLVVSQEKCYKYDISIQNTTTPMHHLAYFNNIVMARLDGVVLRI